MMGGNVSGFTEYDRSIFLEPGFPVAEIEECDYDE
jgi:hypothetical protein